MGGLGGGGGISDPSLGYPDLFRIPEGKVWALSCANRLTLECRNLTAGHC